MAALESKRKRLDTSLAAMVITLMFAPIGLLILGLVIYIVCGLRRQAEIERVLKRHYLANPDTPPPEWVSIGLIQLGTSTTPMSGYFRKPLPMGLSPVGLWIRMPQMLTVCFPWQAIKLEHRSKLGFFRAEFTIFELRVDEEITMTLKSSDPRVGQFIEQCEQAIDQRNKLQQGEGSPV